MKNIFLPDKKMKKYSPVRVSNTNLLSSFHLLKVYPLQGIIIDLRDPHLCIDGLPEDACYEIKINTDWFFLEKKHDTPYAVSYLLLPKFDNSEWTNECLFSLGNICVQLVSGNKKKIHSETIIGIVQNSKNEDFIVAINPSGIIRIEPHQSLQVICFERSWNNWKPGMLESDGFRDQWGSIVSYKRDMPFIMLEKTGQYIIDNDENGVNYWRLKENPFLSPSLKEKIKKEINNLVPPARSHCWWYKISKHSMPNVMDLQNGFYDFADIVFEGKCPCEVGIGGGIELTSKKKFVIYLDVRAKTKKKAQKMIATASTPLTERKFDSIRNILTNPKNYEHLHFSVEKEDFTVELAQPNCFYEDMPENSLWSFTIESGGSNKLGVFSLPHRIVEGKRIQVFRVINTNKKALDPYTRWLGAVNFFVNNDFNVRNRRLSCWITSPIGRAVSVPPNKSKKIHISTHHYSVVGYTKPKITKCDIKFEEVVETLQGNARTFKINDIFGKKKRSVETTKTKEPSNGKLYTTVGIDKTNFTLYNPDHLYVFTFSKDQSLSIRMKIHGENPWTAVAYSTNESFRLPFSKVVSCGETRYQEIGVEVDNPPVGVGTHCLGRLHLQCAEDRRIIYLKYKNLKSNVVSQSLIEDLRIISPDKVLSNNIKNGKKVVVRDWCHQDVILMKPDEFVYVRSPFSAWDQDRWTLEIEQFGIPEEVWKNDKLQHVLDKFDKKDLWIKSITPLQMSNSYLFRPLEIQQPYIHKLIEAIRDCTTISAFPIAKLKFSNSQHPANSCVETSYGEINTSFKINRFLWLALSIRDSIATFINPTNCQILDIGTNKYVTIRLSAETQEEERIGKTTKHWRLKVWPKFLINFGSEVSGGYSEFKFVYNGENNTKEEDWIVFNLGKKELNIKVVKP